jgi:hypothetical protein
MTPRGPRGWLAAAGSELTGTQEAGTSIEMPSAAPPIVCHPGPAAAVPVASVLPAGLVLAAGLVAPPPGWLLPTEEHAVSARNKPGTASSARPRL